MSGTIPQPGLDPCPGCGKSIGDSWLVCAWCGFPLSTSAELPAGSRLEDRYVVERVLGRGGFGITYAVFDTRLQRRVALKEMFPPSAVRHGSQVLAAPGERVEFSSARERFLREARLLARFSHPGIVRVYEVFEASNTAYMVMELLDGLTLAEMLAERGAPFSVEEVLDVASRVGAALEEVHAADLLHRDVNPSNVMVTSSGRVVLIDFGVARFYGGESTGQVTRVVTPGFAPPEQYSGSGSLGPTADVYGLAASLYRLLSGRTPPSPLERQGGVELIAPDRIAPGTAKIVSDAVLDGLELQPSHRPVSVRAFLDRLGLHGAEPTARAVLSPPPGAPPTLWTVAAPRLTGADAGPETPGGPVAPPDATVAASLHAPRQAAGLAVAATHGFAWEPPGTPIGSPGSMRPGTGEPLVVGPHPPGRRPLTVALTLAIASLASSTPVVVTVLLCVVLLPLLATIGDMSVHRARLAAGATERSWHRAPATSLLPVHVVRNLLVSIMRAVPALALGGIVVLVAWLAHRPGTELLRDWVVRIGGAAVACAVAVPARDDGRGFRTGRGLAVVISRFLDDRGRLALSGWAAVLVCAGLAAGGLWLSPELWPLPW